MLYPVAIEKGSEHSAFGVVVPDVPGCFSAGDTFEEALTNIQEAAELYLESLSEEEKKSFESKSFVIAPLYIQTSKAV